jgi:hypothetical protein
MKQPIMVISDGAKKRLFNMAIKANDRLENCDSDDEYKAAKKRSSEWNEIVMALGLTQELRQYYEEKRGNEQSI